MSTLGYVGAGVAHRWWSLVAALLLCAGCGGGTRGKASDGGATLLDAALLDGAVRDGALACDGGRCCVTDDDCAVGPDDDGGLAYSHCDPQSHVCVECLGDEQCGAGTVCRDHRCAAGCTLEHDCSDAQTCCQGACLDLARDPSNCGACGVACPGAEACCGGLCLALDGDDPSHCGGCDVACPAAPHGSPSCTAGRCGVLCDEGRADCDGQLDDGCEVDLRSDVRHCGGCDTACPAAPHTTFACVDGGCVLSACAPGWADCDGRVDDGCEVDLQSDVEHCGSCEQACPPVPNAAPACLDGHCGTGPCGGRWQDCDASGSNGCETDVATNPSSCGGCGTACPTPSHGTAACRDSLCGLGACDTGFGDCDRLAANGCEIDLRGDGLNCGACGTSCVRPHARTSCASGLCQLLGCDPGWASCDGNDANGCETDIADSASHCGACGVVCPTRPHTATATCRDGACGFVCVAGWADCDGDPANGCEVDLSTDAAHCGACATVCPTGPHQGASCAGGTCGLVCQPGWADCDGVGFNGCERSVASDPDHCGGCAIACAPAPRAVTVGCAMSACVVTSCASGYGDCDGGYANGCEADLTEDVRHCGACDNACVTPSHAATTCDGGVCGMGACESGWADCDHDPANGCEAHPVDDVNHCGGCDVACAAVAHGAPGCSSGSCAIASCAAGWADCNGLYGDGCEAQLGGDPQNCGGCGKACSYAHGVGACLGGEQCALAACDAGHASCDGSDANGCEADLQVDAAHCGACDKACATSEYCRAGKCQARLKLLLLHSESIAAYVADVRSRLSATGLFAVIDSYDARAAAPDLATLAGYDAVLAWSSAGVGFADPTALGDVLADYYDGGGRVVVAMFGNFTGGIGGRFGALSNGYLLITGGTAVLTGASSLGAVAEPSSPLVQGVDQLSATTAFRSDGVAVNGGTVVASWSGGEPLVVRGVIGGRRRVDLNLWPVSSAAYPNSWTGDGTSLLIDALLYQ